MNPNPSPRGRQQAGIALLEVLVAILLFSFGILGLIGLQARAISFSTDAEDRNRAAMLANEVATLMWLNNSLTVPEPSLTPWKARVGASLSSGVGEVVPDAAAGAADVLITWRAPSKPASEPASQLVTRVVLP
jgi:type IV pilus assembly protein PilV